MSSAFDADVAAAMRDPLGRMDLHTAASVGDLDYLIRLDLDTPDLDLRAAQRRLLDGPNVRGLLRSRRRRRLPPRPRRQRRQRRRRPQRQGPHAADDGRHVRQRRHRPHPPPADGDGRRRPFGGRRARLHAALPRGRLRPLGRHAAAPRGRQRPGRDGEEQRLLAADAGQPRGPRADRPVAGPLLGRRRLRQHPRRERQDGGVRPRPRQDRPVPQQGTQGDDGPGGPGGGDHAERPRRAGKAG